MAQCGGGRAHLISANSCIKANGSRETGTSLLGIPVSCFMGLPYWNLDAQPTKEECEVTRPDRNLHEEMVKTKKTKAANAELSKLPQWARGALPRWLQENYPWVETDNVNDVDMVVRGEIRTDAKSLIARDASKPALPSGAVRKSKKKAKKKAKPKPKPKPKPKTDDEEDERDDKEDNVEDERDDNRGQLAGIKE
ncbi:hypothetical protein M011DRAFT_464232 [Sporormia fimetaria CBS 119925]|uniref:Uncharacterized protein n=1 Tax=Sporormia fimetaria CBS 119925 TaxID=1340428 RepID=A0A6A6VP22_9PLEO|nr:hypothetical protein M011DRAFT_464232 [Sporormia fimetaria CBS 119925]